MNGALPPPRSLGNGIHTIAAPLPFPSPSWVNCYAIEDDAGLTLIDCGCDWEPGHEALTRGMAEVGLADVPVHTLIVSHLHPDHVGMADRVRAETGARLLMHKRASTRMAIYNDTAGFVRRNLELASRHGVPDEYAAALAGSQERPTFMPPLQPPDVVVEDGDQIRLAADRRLSVLHTPGHEPAHICLQDSRTGVVFSGDHVLPRISPVIPFDEEYGDVLGDYLTSLRRLLELPIRITYPAHGGIIERGAARVEQILLHHDRRLDQMREKAEASPTTAWMLIGELFRPHLEPDQQRLALRETVAHLEHLCLGAGLGREDRHGVLWYRA